MIGALAVSRRLPSVLRSAQLLRPCQYRQPRPVIRRQFSLFRSVSCMPPDSEFVAAIKQEPGFWNPSQFGLGYRSSYLPTGWLQTLLEYYHLELQLPWWGSISLLAISLRWAFLWVTVNELKYKVRMHNNETRNLKHQISAMRQTGKPDQVATALFGLHAAQDEHGELARRSKRLVYIQAAVFISWMGALSGLVQPHPVPGLNHGGALWFPNLAIFDGQLPFIAAVSWGLAYHLAGRLATDRMQRKSVPYRLLQLGGPVTILFAGSYFPAAVTLYWATSNLFSLFFYSINQSAAVRRLFSIPLIRQRDAAEVQTLNDELRRLEQRSRLAELAPPLSPPPPPLAPPGDEQPKLRLP